MFRSRVVRAAAAVAALTVLAAACGDTEDTAQTATTTTEEHGAPSVSFTSPADGDAVSNPVIVTFAAEGFIVEPAGDVHDGAGHLHVMVDVPCVAAGESVPKDAQHLHFGKGQLEGSIDLAAGEHTLCLQAADGAHTALDVTREVTFTVEA